MNRTKIEWAGYTWNPIKGLCPEDCKTPDGKSYCYARAMYQRFGWDKKKTLDRAFIERYGIIPPDSKVFICSTFELFHPAVPKTWRDWIFEQVEKRKDLTFIVLTKHPELIDRPMPANVWLGASVTGRQDQWRVDKLFGSMAKTRFISFEPLLESAPSLSTLSCELLDWIIVGRMTGHGRKNDPKREWIQEIVTIARLYGLPVFLKNNLREVWGSDLIQEYPRVAP